MGQKWLLQARELKLQALESGAMTDSPSDSRVQMTVFLLAFVTVVREARMAATSTVVLLLESMRAVRLGACLVSV